MAVHIVVKIKVTFVTTVSENVDRFLLGFRPEEHNFIPKEGMWSCKVGLLYITKLLGLLFMFPDVQAAQNLVKLCEQDFIARTE